jgi:hypothetical protein
VVSEVRIYVEGGGDDKEGKARLREGFGHFLDDLRAMARRGQIKWQIIICGPRHAAYRNFQHALEDHPDAFNVLLIDSEGPVSDMPWLHLYRQDKWSSLDTTDEQCHLMVQMMEAWLIADVEALRGFYGPNFNVNPIPNNPNVEEIPKQTLVSALQAATRKTTKGEYHKVRHSPKILARLDVAKVRNAASHCDRLFKTLVGKLELTL